MEPPYVIVGHPQTPGRHVGQQFLIIAHPCSRPAKNQKLKTKNRLQKTLPVSPGVWGFPGNKTRAWWGD
jgi:hypothetical protein